MVRHTPIEIEQAEPVREPQGPAPKTKKAVEQPAAPKGYTLEPNVDLWVQEQVFEEDVRAVLRMMRPHGRERLQGWKEYRTGGAHFRVTVSWDDEFQITSPDTALAVPHMTDVMETLLVGSVRAQDEMDSSTEFEHYRSVVRDLYQRLEQREASSD